MCLRTLVHLQASRDTYRLIIATRVSDALRAMTTDDDFRADLACEKRGQLYASAYREF